MTRCLLGIGLALAAACGPATSTTGTSEEGSNDGIVLCVWHNPVGAPGCVTPARIDFFTVPLGRREVRRVLVSNRTPDDVVFTRQINGAWLSVSGPPSTTLTAGSSDILEITLIQGAPPGQVVGRLDLAMEPVEGSLWQVGLDVRATILGCPPGSAICDDSFASGCDCPKSCKPGFFGETCLQCPGSTDTLVCNGHGWCDDGIKGTGGCFCSAAWTGLTCDIDVNECLLDPCSVNATCDNFDGGFSCTCNEGFIGGGLTCSPAPCDSMDVAHGSEIASGLHGTTASDFTCDAGYAPVPAEDPTCQYGVWSAPACLVVDGGPCATDSDCVNVCAAGVCAP